LDFGFWNTRVEDGGWKIEDGGWRMEERHLGSWFCDLGFWNTVVEEVEDGGLNMEDEAGGTASRILDFGFFILEHPVERWRMED
jgi:hypothetical protein